MDSSHTPSSSASAGSSQHEGKTDGAPRTNPFQCNICFEDSTNPVVTQCGHLYCWPCLYEWLARGKNTCPVCKAGVTRDNVIPLYGRDGERVDPRSNTPPVPPRPAAARPDAPPQQAFGGHGGPNIHFTAGFGFVPSLFGMYFYNNNGNGWNAGPHGPGLGPNPQAASLRAMLFALAVFVLVAIIFL